MAKFLIKSDLPIGDQRKIDALELIPAAQRTVSQAAYLTALAPYRTNLIISIGEDALIIVASGLTVPTGDSGFRKGAIFIKTDATGNGEYMNTGTPTTSAWDLVDQATTTNIDDGAVTLPKMANMATASLIYRKTAATGVPEVNTLATLKTDLGLAGSNSGDQTITLTGNVTGTGTGTFATTIATLPTGTPVNAVASSMALTSDDTEISDGETVSIGGTVYRFKDTMAQAYDVQRHGTTADTTMGNLIAAINASGTPGVEYFAGTLIHPDVSAGVLAAHAFTATAKVKGVAGDLIALAESTSHMVWTGGATFLAGGVNGTVGVQWQPRVDATNLYICTATNTINDANWKKLVLTSM